MYLLVSLVGAALVGATLTVLIAQVFGRGEMTEPVAARVEDRQHITQYGPDVTAEDVRNVQFSQSLRGYDPREVDMFLDVIQQRLAELEKQQPIGKGLR